MGQSRCGRVSRRIEGVVQMLCVFVRLRRSRCQNGMRCRHFLFYARELFINLRQFGGEVRVQFVDPAHKIGNGRSRRGLRSI